MPGESSSGRLGDGPVHSNCHVFWHYSHINLGSNHADKLTIQTRNFRHLFVSSFTFILHLSTWINKGSFMIMNWRFTCAVCLLTSDGLPCLGQVTKCLMADCLTTITLDPGDRVFKRRVTYTCDLCQVRWCKKHGAARGTNTNTLFL